MAQGSGRILTAVYQTCAAPRFMVAHTDKLEGYRPMSDELIWVVGMRLKKRMRVKL